MGRTLIGRLLGQLVQKLVVLQAHLMCWTTRLDLALVKPNGALTQGLHLVDVVRAKENGDPLVLQGHDAVKGLPGKGAVAHRQGLIDHQNIRLHARGNREREPHVHATRIGFDGLVDEVLNARELDDGLHLVLDLLGTEPQEGGIQLDVFSSREVRVETGPKLEECGDAAPHLHRTARGLKHPADELQQGRLARPIDPHNPQDLSSGEYQGDIPQGPKLLVKVGQRLTVIRLDARVIVQSVGEAMKTQTPTQRQASGEERLLQSVHRVGIDPVAFAHRLNLDGPIAACVGGVAACIFRVHRQSPPWSSQRTWPQQSPPRGSPHSRSTSRSSGAKPQQR